MDQEVPQEGVLEVAAPVVSIDNPVRQEHL